MRHQKPLKKRLSRSQMMKRREKIARRSLEQMKRALGRMNNA